MNRGLPVVAFVHKADVSRFIAYLFRTGTVPTPSIAKYATTAVQHLTKVGIKPQDLPRLQSNICNPEHAMFAKMFFI